MFNLRFVIFNCFWFVIYFSQTLKSSVSDKLTIYWLVSTPKFISSKDRLNTFGRHISCVPLAYFPMLYGSSKIYLAWLSVWIFKLFPGLIDAFISWSFPSSNPLLYPSANPSLYPLSYLFPL